MNTIEEMEFLINSYKKATDKKEFFVRLKQLYLEQQVSKSAFMAMKLLIEEETSNEVKTRPKKPEPPDPCSRGGGIGGVSRSPC